MRALPIILLAAATLSNAFLNPLPSAKPRTLMVRSHTLDVLSLARNIPDYSVIEDDDEQDYNEIESQSVASDYTVVNTEEETSTVQSTKPRRKYEYAAFSPGSATTLQIQVGDMALARKAWKKRRRSGSPLLVPCSILNIGRVSMLRENLVLLLYKFGAAQVDGVAMSVDDLEKRFKSHLKGDLLVRQEID